MRWSKILCLCNVQRTFYLWDTRYDDCQFLSDRTVSKNDFCIYLSWLSGMPLASDRLLVAYAFLARSHFCSQGCKVQTSNAPRFPGLLRLPWQRRLLGSSNLPYLEFVFSMLLLDNWSSYRCGVPSDPKATK